MKAITWSDGLLSRSRTPFLFFVKDNNIYDFDGKSIAGICVIKNSNYTKKGKWSNTDYTLLISDDVICFEMCRPFSGYGETFDDIRYAFTLKNGDFEFTDEFIISLADKYFKNNGFFREAVNEAIKNKKMIETLI